MGFENSKSESCVNIPVMAIEVKVSKVTLLKRSIPSTVPESNSVVVNSTE